MAACTVDLHNHSPHVSGDYRGPAGTTPADLVTAALDAGVDVLGVSDHFSVGYALRVAEAASSERERTGRALLVLPGAELKLRWRDDEVHLIALFEPEHAQHRFSALQTLLGMDPGDDPATLHRVCVERDPRHVARAIDALGGLSHIAHADRWFGDYRLLDRPIFSSLLVEAPITAVELLDLGAEALVRERSTVPVRCIRSSDSHSPDEIGRRTSSLEMAEPTFAGLRRALTSLPLPV